MQRRQFELLKVWTPWCTKARPKNRWGKIFFVAASIGWFHYLISLFDFIIWFYYLISLFDFIIWGRAFLRLGIFESPSEFLRCEILYFGFLFWFTIILKAPQKLKEWAKAQRCRRFDFCPSLFQFLPLNATCGWAFFLRVCYWMRRPWQGLFLTLVFDGQEGWGGWHFEFLFLCILYISILSLSLSFQVGKFGSYYLETLDNFSDETSGKSLYLVELRQPIPYFLFWFFWWNFPTCLQRDFKIILRHITTKEEKPKGATKIKGQ